MTYDTGAQGRVHFGLEAKGSGLVKRQLTAFAPPPADDDDDDEEAAVGPQPAGLLGPRGAAPRPTAEGKVKFGEVAKGGGVVKRTPTRFVPAGAREDDDDDEEEEEAAGPKPDLATQGEPGSQQTIERASSPEGKVKFGQVAKGGGVVRRQPTRFVPAGTKDGEDDDEEEAAAAETATVGCGSPRASRNNNGTVSPGKVHFGLVAKGSGLVKRQQTRFAPSSGDAEDEEEDEEENGPTPSTTVRSTSSPRSTDHTPPEASAKVKFGQVAKGGGVVKRQPTRFVPAGARDDEDDDSNDDDREAPEKEAEVDERPPKSTGSGSSAQGKVKFGQVAKGSGLVKRTPTRFVPAGAKDDDEDDEEEEEAGRGEGQKLKAASSPRSARNGGPLQERPISDSLLSEPSAIVKNGSDNGDQPSWVQYGSWQKRIVSDSLVISEEPTSPTERMLSDSAASHNNSKVKHVSFGQMPDAAQLLSISPLEDPTRLGSGDQIRPGLLEIPSPRNAKTDQQFRVAATTMSEQIVQPQIRLMIVRTVSTLKSKAASRGDRGPEGILQPEDRASITSQIVKPAVEVIVNRAADHMFKVNFLRPESLSDSDVPMRNFLASVMERAAIVDEIVELATDVLTQNVEGLEPKDIRAVEDDTLRPAVCRMVEAVAVAFRKELTFLRECTLDVSDMAVDDLDEEEEKVTEEVMKTMRPAIRLIVEKATASFRRILTVTEDELQPDPLEVTPKPTPLDGDYAKMQRTFSEDDCPMVKISITEDCSQPDPVELPIVDEDPILQDAMQEMRPAVRSMVKAAAALKVQELSELPGDQCTSPTKRAFSFLPLSPMNKGFNFPLSPMNKLAVPMDGAQQDSRPSSRRGSTVVELAEETFETLRPAIRNVVFKAAEAFKAKLSHSRDSSAADNPLSPTGRRDLKLSVACSAVASLPSPTSRKTNVSSPTMKSLPSPTKLSLTSPRREVTVTRDSTLSEVSDVTEDGEEEDHPVVQAAFATMRPAVWRMVEKAHAAFMSQLSCELNITRDDSQMDPLVVPDSDAPQIHVDCAPGFTPGFSMFGPECMSPRVGRTLTCTADARQPDFIEMPDSDGEEAPPPPSQPSWRKTNAQATPAVAVEATEVAAPPPPPSPPAAVDAAGLAPQAPPPAETNPVPPDQQLSPRPRPLLPLTADGAATPARKAPARGPPAAGEAGDAGRDRLADVAPLRATLGALTPEQGRDLLAALLDPAGGGTAWAQRVAQQLRDVTGPSAVFGLWQSLVAALPLPPPPSQAAAPAAAPATPHLRHLHYLEAQLEQLATLYSTDLHLETCRAMALEQEVLTVEHAGRDPELLRHHLDFLTNYCYHLGAHVTSLRRHHCAALDFVKGEVAEGPHRAPSSNVGTPLEHHDDLLQEVLEAKLRAVECVRGDLSGQTAHASTLEDRLHRSAQTLAPAAPDLPRPAHVAELEHALQAEQRTVRLLQARTMDLEGFVASAAELRREVEQLRGLLDEEVQHSASLRRQVEQLTTQVVHREQRIQKLEQGTPSTEMQILRACVDEEVKRNGELRREVERLSQEMQRREAVNACRIRELEGQLEQRSTASSSSIGAPDLPLGPRPSQRMVWYATAVPEPGVRCSPHRCVLNHCRLCRGPPTTPTRPAEPAQP